MKILITDWPQRTVVIDIHLTGEIFSAGKQLIDMKLFFLFLPFTLSQTDKTSHSTILLVIFQARNLEEIAALRIELKQLRNELDSRER